MIFVTWCIFKLDCYDYLWRYFRIIIVAYDIRNMGIKMISLSWAVGDVTKTSDLYDHIQAN